MDPVLRASLMGFALCFLLAAFAPAPRKPPPGERAAYLSLLLAGTVTFAASASMPLLGLWIPGIIGMLAAASMVMFCMWLARSPLARDTRSDEEGEDSGGGGGGRRVPRPEPPEPTSPRGAPVPEGPSLDWGSFDDARRGWETPADDRELVGV